MKVLKKDWEYMHELIRKMDTEYFLRLRQQLSDEDNQKIDASFDMNADELIYMHSTYNGQGDYNLLRKLEVAVMYKMPVCSVGDSMYSIAVQKIINNEEVGYEIVLYCLYVTSLYTTEHVKRHPTRERFYQAILAQKRIPFEISNDCLLHLVTKYGKKPLKCLPEGATKWLYAVDYIFTK